MLRWECFKLKYSIIFFQLDVFFLKWKSQVMINVQNVEFLRPWNTSFGFVPAQSPSGMILLFGRNPYLWKEQFTQTCPISKVDIANQIGITDFVTIQMELSKNEAWFGIAIWSGKPIMQISNVSTVGYLKYTCNRTEWFKGLSAYHYLWICGCSSFIYTYTYNAHHAHMSVLIYIVHPWPDKWRATKCFYLWI